MEKKQFNVRGFISLLTACSFILMSVTGIVLYFTPQGRIAFWTNWKFIGLTKTHWVDIHVLSCLLFLVAGVYHIYNNWRSLWHYVWDRLGRTMPLMTELILSVMITVLITIGAIYLFPPFDYVITFSDFLKSSWVKSKEYEPPIGHAELLSLKAFSRRMHIDLSEAVQELKSNGIILDEDGNQSLEAIAKKNKTSPHDLYVLIRKYEVKAVDDEGSAEEPRGRDRDTHPVEPSPRLPEDAGAHVSRSGARPSRRRLPDHSVQSRHRLRRLVHLRQQRGQRARELVPVAVRDDDRGDPHERPSASR